MNISRLIDDFSGLSEAETAAEKHRAVASKLAEAGHTISPNGVKKWVERDSIPGEWLVRILVAGQKNKQPIDVKNYV